ncbi:MAG: MBL fold metallo-hydrolase [Gammaproteobacteria bacterium]|nr:MBL fold metallo-hydrolase [Gammaproteobacteria bacterium]
MRYASLGSGSKGNATLVESGDSCVMIDCGFNHKQTVSRLQQAGKTAEDITAICLTHEHGDHVAGAKLFSKRYGTPVYMTKGTAEALKDIATQVLIEAGEVLCFGEMALTGVAVSHDAREPCQYVVEEKGKRLGVLTDIGFACEAVLKAYQGCDALILEANYDDALLEEGYYPESVKARIAGDGGHLSNEQSLGLLKALGFNKPHALSIAHVSEKNNCREAIISLFRQHFGEDVEKMDFICQQNGMQWRTLA